MCGIAGIVSLTGPRPLPPGALRRMADALAHRGPDDEGFLEREGVGFASRRLSIVGLSDGHQPMSNEDGSVAVVFNGELFDYPESRRVLESAGHRFATHCDTELVPHLWEDHQEHLFDRLRGQFAFAVHDARRRRVVLGRDRFGICPLYWSRQRTSDGDWLLFASEVRALIASGLVRPALDPRGIDQVFHFFAVPGPATCFRDVQALQPGHLLVVDFAAGRAVAAPEIRTTWTIDFPARGDEEDGDELQLVDRLEQLMLAAVERRLRADVPVVSYLSGGIDSSLVLAMGARIRGEPTPAFTIQVQRAGFDESKHAARVAQHVGARPVVVPVSPADVARAYPELIRATEAPVIDTSSAASMLLAAEVHRHGFKVALTGEGSDEWLAGYSWYKVNRLAGWLDVVPGIRLSGVARRTVGRVMGVAADASDYLAEIDRRLGPRSAFHEVYALMTASRFMFFEPAVVTELEQHDPYLALEPDVTRLLQWHPINRAAWWAARIHLPGHLLSLKGDRVAMHSSVETRYPFLDEEVFTFLARLHPRWKLRGLRDKYLLRRMAERYLPAAVAWRPKKMFLAPFDSFFGRGMPAYVDELLSEGALRATGLFNVRAVHHWKQRLESGRVPLRLRRVVELGMVGVLATQLWYQAFVDGGLARIDGKQAGGCAFAGADRALAESV